MSAAPNIKRVSNVQESVTAGTTLAACTAIDMSAHAGGVLYVPAGAASQTYTYYVSPTSGGTYLALSDKDATAVTIAVVASNAYELHTAGYGALFIKLLAGTSEETGLTVMKKG